MSLPADPQAALVARLQDLVADEVVTCERLLELVREHLAAACGVGGALVVDTAAQVPPAAAAVLPLRLLGDEHGLLVLLGEAPPRVRPEVLRALTHLLALVRRAAADRRAREEEAVLAAAVRRLFEEGVHAGSVREAAQVLARVTADVFAAERVAVHLSEADGRVQDLLDVGVPADVAAELRRQVVGRLAGDSPVWRRSQREGGPVLVDDVRLFPGRPGGFVATMGLRSYAAMPLLSASGIVGMVVCGDVSRWRSWSEREHRVARQLALEGALVIDSARLRQVERARLEEMRRRADTDALTDLPNRRRLTELLADAVAATGPGAGGALLVVDLDGFKQVNDTLGHHAGDELLRQVARRLLHGIRGVDVAARLGGDEFAVLLRGVGVPDALAGAGRLRAALAAPVVVDGRRARVGASIGVAALADHPGDVDGLLRAADGAMYEAKRTRSGPRLAG
ncbi:diguanylate cyclase [Kineococcus sp. SYSU DK006]|uniref:diguanylate cyclase n=1 Tax=Kineococcus sp. SYSU DK006 TaxID=3383127 RepID=UPI003D7D4FB3